MYYSYVEIEYVATSFSPTRTDLAVKLLTMWNSRPSFKTNLSESHTAEWIIFAVTGISLCSPLFETPFATVVLDGFLLLMKGSSLMNWLLFPSFFWTWCDKQCCQARLHPSNRGRWFFVWGLFIQQAHYYLNQWNTALKAAAIVSKMQTQEINETLLSRKQQSCQKCEHRQSHFDFPNTDSKKISTWISLLKRNNLLAKLSFS